ncbi:hypothetical protein L6164_027493 [Bauhinia variegata]|uniref:Uncharacterized protein n=1 Tax=Bauhinia variegata TaxID=167791 RepID=A0ACB9LTJ6_BAUVA|nr:hypothetical protein L6164_027493 [Bauhinia variegata]
METPLRCKFTFISIVISLSFGLISCILCAVAEFKRNKKEDLRWSGSMCYLPPSQAFGWGIAALACLFVAQIIGNFIFFKHSCSGGERNAIFKTPAIAKVLFLISWVSFGSAVVLLFTATSMSRRQQYGVGWLNGECYLVKGGTYAGSAILVLVTLGSIISSSLSTKKTSHVDQAGKQTVHLETAQEK